MKNRNYKGILIHKGNIDLRRVEVISSGATAIILIPCLHHDNRQ